MEPSQYLNDIESEKIRQFVGDKLMFGAIKKILLASVYRNGVMEAGKPHDATINSAFITAFSRPSATNEELGAELRAKAEGIRFVEVGFDQLEKLATPEPKGESAEQNPAR